MRRSIKLSLAAAALLAVMCSGAWAADVVFNGNDTDWTDGNTYIVKKYAWTGRPIEVRGSVTLILNDGCMLRASKGIYVERNSTLTIKTPAGSKGTGTLSAKAMAVGSPGIGSRGGKCNITIAGGTVTATGYRRAGISGNVTITGGTVTAMGTQGGAGIGGWGAAETVTITGGTVTAIGIKNGPGIAGDNVAITGGKVTAVGFGSAGIGGKLSSGADGSAWIVTHGVDTDKTGFTSGVLFNGSDGAVYGDQTIGKNIDVPGGKTLTIKDGRKLTVAQGKTLTVSKGATLTLESGGQLVNSGTIVNNGRIRLPEGSSIEAFGLNTKNSGVIEIGGKALPKEPTQKEKDAAKKIIDKIKGAGSAASGIRAADDDPMEAEVEPSDILFDAEDVEGALVTMSIKVAAKPDQYAIIADHQMVDVAPGSDIGDDLDDDEIDYEDIDDEDANGVDDTLTEKIVYVDRFVAPGDATKSSDVELDDVSVEDEDDGAAELAATLVVFNGKASKEVQAMPEYTPSGLVDGQGLAVFWDEEFEMHVLVIFDGDETDGVATGLIYAKEEIEETPQRSASGGGSGCAAGAAALVALIGLAMMKRR